MTFYRRFNIISLVMVGFFLSSCQYDEEDVIGCPPYRSGQRGLIISEISPSVFYRQNNPRKLIMRGNPWIEIYNLDDQEVNLCHYQLEATSLSFDIADKEILPPDLLKVKRFSLPNQTIDPGSYVLLRFNNSISYNDDYSSKQVVYVNQNIGGKITIPILLQYPYRYYSKFRSRLKGNFTLIRKDYEITDQIDCSFKNSNRCEMISSENSFSRISLGDPNSGWEERFPTPGGLNDVRANLKDDDKDGIPDANEHPGTTFIGMPLYDWGARPGQKDIFVHINYMAGDDPGLIPYQRSLEKIVHAFDQAGFKFKLHFDVGNLHHSSRGDYNLSDQSHRVPFEIYTDLDGSFYRYKNRYMPLRRLQIFHYMLLANHVISEGKLDTRILGIAEVEGNDSIISWGMKGLWRFKYGDSCLEILNREKVTKTDPLEQCQNYIENSLAYTMMHELGHNLGLRHGGDTEINNKPNYLSTMNYLYGVGLPVKNNKDPENFAARYYWNQTSQGKKIIPSGYPYQRGQMTANIYSRDFRIDFSHGQAADLDESNLDETKWLLKSGNNLFGEVDWNLNGKPPSPETSVARDINFDNKKEKLTDYNDWGKLKLPFATSFQGYSDYRASQTGRLRGSTLPIARRFNPLDDDRGNWQD